MGNAIGGKDRKVAKVMKITGETLKFKAPVEAGEILKDHPGLVLLDSESVKHYGVRAKPLAAHQMLQPRRLYFLVELPKEKGVPRRVRSGINMSAKDRLENLMLTRRSTSDLSVMAKAAAPGNGDRNDGAAPAVEVGGKGKDEDAVGSAGTRLRLRLPKGEVERLMRESRDEAEAAERIMRLYISDNKQGDGNSGSDQRNDGGRRDDSVGKIEGKELSVEEQQQPQWEGSHGRRKESLKKRTEKRVSFMAVREEGMQIAVAS